MFIGRDHELSLVRSRLSDRSKAQLIVLYGRRRIGKSRLIREAVSDETGVLFFEGLQGARTAQQLAQFTGDLARQTGRVRLAAKTWGEAFQGLGEIVEDGRWVVVFDEFPWMGAGRTRIVSDLKLYWDRWSKNPNLALFLCGSVASFMSRHVVHSTALHNRKTLELCLGPLQPFEVAEFMPKRSIAEKTRLYMCLGGVPKYLEQIDPRHSLEKNLNRLCFTAGGFFVNEFETLFKEQFRSLKVYESVAQRLSVGPASLTELSTDLGVAKGGGFAGQMENLVYAEFVRKYRPVTLGRSGRTRTAMFKLTDPFLLFYFRHMHGNRAIIARNRRENLFRAIVGPTAAQYYGYAFERLVEDALDTVLRCLGISLADIIEMGPYFQQRGRQGRGLQIDWVIRRRDGVWNILEYKHTSTAVGPAVVEQMQEKIRRLAPPCDVMVEPVLVSAAGATPSVIDSGYFSAVLGLDDLVTLI